MNDYILYDERGVLDPDEASILEAFDSTDDAAAFQEAVATWPEHSWALYNSANLIGWSSPKQKSILRWFAEWDKPHQYDYAGKRQKYDAERKGKVAP